MKPIAYPQYKNSGIEWLGHIPAHWETTSLKRVANRIQTGATPPTAETRYYEEGTVPWYGPGSFSVPLPIQKPVKFLSRSAIQDGVARVFDAGSTMIVTIGATIGKVAYLEKPGSCNQQITGVSFDAHLTTPRYGAYQLKRLEPMLRGIAPNTTLPILDQEEVGYLPLAIPPVREQQAIADFLDRETAKIDALVDKKERLIKLLQEKRAALITQAVTKGLDPDVPMKDSGIEWLGQIPAHWDCMRVKSVAIMQAGVGITSEAIEESGDYPVYGGNGLRGYTTAFTHTGSVVLVGRQGALCGNVNYASGQFWASEHAVVVEPSRGVDVRWLGETLRSMKLNDYSVAAAQPGLAVDRILALGIAVPPEQEQHAIANHLDRETAKIDALVAKVGEAIERLKEYRTALISAAVTGKIDVRN